MEIKLDNGSYLLMKKCIDEFQILMCKDEINTCSKCKKINMLPVSNYKNFYDAKNSMEIFADMFNKGYKEGVDVNHE